MPSQARVSYTLEATDNKTLTILFNSAGRSLPRGKLRDHESREKPADQDRAQLHQHVDVAKAPPGSAAMAMAKLPALLSPGPG